MVDAKKTYPKIATPRVTLKFPKLAEPDYGSKDYPKPDGEYSTKAILKADSPEAKKLIAMLQPHYDAAMEAADAEFASLAIGTRKKLGKVTRNDLFNTVYDKETEEPTGEIEFKFSMKAGGTRKKGPKTGQRWSRTPDIYDAKGNLMRKCPDIWGGTVARISAEVQPYFIPGTGAAGIKLALSGVQVIDLVSGGSRTASSHGFEAEDGYEHQGFDDETQGEAGTDTPAGQTEDF